MTTNTKTAVLILGGGPAGASAALNLLERGIKPVIVEREKFPRFHIGESMTGECGALVRNLGLEDAMIEADHPVKHGVVVYGKRGNGDWWVPVMRRNPDLTLDFNPTWQVRRSTFDKMLLDAATARGAELIHGAAVAPLREGSNVRGAEIQEDKGSKVRIEAEMTLDCTGQATFLANRGVTGPKYTGSYDKQIALFSHVANFVRDEDTDDAKIKANNTHIYYASKYHWAWAIPVDREVTSVGIVVPSAYFQAKGESKEAFFLRELQELNPALTRRTEEAKLVEDVHVIPNYSFQVRKFAGPGYICVGDSHRFVDPIFSFGLYLALKEAALAASATVDYLGGQGRDSADPFHAYMINIEKGIDILEDSIDTFWENPLAFAYMVHERYREQLIDIFAGRVYDDSITKDRDRATAAFRKLLKRERTYDDAGLFSVPIGSRFHPERAPLWNSELDSIETTERWIRDNE